jgi:hypothetical protein
MPEWRKQYARFMQNAPLKSLAEEQAPEVIQWLEARVKIAQLAEQAIVAPPTPEGKLAFMVRKQKAQADEQIALATAKGEKLIEGEAQLDALPLDDDRKEYLKTELAESILENEKEQENGKDSETL